MIRTVKVPSGQNVEAELRLPDLSGKDCPSLVFFACPPEVKIDFDIYIQSIIQSGRAVFQFSSSKHLSVDDIKCLYKIASEQSGVNRNELVYLSFKSYADYFSKAYYQFFAISPPYAAVLVHCTSEVADLDNLTCPYLLIHEQAEFEYQSKSRFDEAVHHHQMRYGDTSSQKIVKSLEESFDQTPVETILHWLHAVPVSPDRPFIYYFHKKYA